MTLAQALLRVRQNLNQTDNTNTLWSDAHITYFYDHIRYYIDNDHLSYYI